MQWICVWKCWDVCLTMERCYFVLLIRPWSNSLLAVSAFCLACWSFWNVWTISFCISALSYRFSKLKNLCCSSFILKVKRLARSFALFQFASSLAFSSVFSCSISSIGSDKLSSLNAGSIMDTAGPLLRFLRSLLVTTTAFFPWSFALLSFSFLAN